MEGFPQSSTEVVKTRKHIEVAEDRGGYGGMALQCNGGLQGGIPNKKSSVLWWSNDIEEPFCGSCAVLCCAKIILECYQ